MKSWTLIMFVATIAVQAWSASAEGETATEAEAWTVAQNYVDLVIAEFGDWGGAEHAEVLDLQELWRGDRLLGYVFPVTPHGFLVVSVHKELAAVKAHAPWGYFDVAAEEGLVDLLKDRMEKTILAVETRLDKPIDMLAPEDWTQLPALRNRPAWDELADRDFDPIRYQTARGTADFTEPGMNYGEHQVLLTSDWHQDGPYNEHVPFPLLGGECTNTVNGRMLVGCVATAGAQILRYWNWPPCNAAGDYVDAYHWSNMPDWITYDSPQDQIDCVAAACLSVGVSVDMDYGCDASGAQTEDMEQVYENRRYHGTCGVAHRNDFSASEWFERIKSQLNINRPLQYRVEDHSIVCDGWYDTEVGGETLRYYHMNYGWSGSGADIWYMLDYLELGGVDEEFMIRRIRPAVSLGDTLAGFYPTQWLSVNHFDRPARYFDQDVTGTSAEFEAGQGFQYLRPGLWIRNVGTSSDEITFHGASGAVTEFYHQAPFGDVKIRIHDGAIKIYGGGEIALY